MSAELVGPLPQVRFGFGENSARVVYTPPKNTLDARYEACTEHRVACDCREAVWAELVQEYRYDADTLQAAFDKILAGHPVLMYGVPTQMRPYTSEKHMPCQCTGCQIARAVSYYPRAGGGTS